MKNKEDIEDDNIEKIANGAEWLGKTIWENPFGKAVIFAGGVFILMGVAGVGFRAAAYMTKGLNEFNSARKGK